jgi:hypothetical protein
MTCFFDVFSLILWSPQKKKKKEEKGYKSISATLSHQSKWENSFSSLSLSFNKKHENTGMYVYID